MTTGLQVREATTVRQPVARHFLMCPPTFFDVVYRINPWMDPDHPVDRPRALRQWERLVRSYRAAGHRVDLLDPVPGLPDMVFAANGATVVDGRVLAARFATAERAPEADHHRAWHRRHPDARTPPDGTGRGLPGGPPTAPAVQEAVAVNEAEGDFAVLADRVLAGHGFRTSRDAHDELARLTGRPVVSLELVDQYLYHLDVALAVLDDRRDHIAYHPPAFSAESQALLAELFPDALLADAADVACLGLNAVSDGARVWLARGADHLCGLLVGAGYTPVEVDLSELRLGGGGVKCCTQEIRPSRPGGPPDPVPPGVLLTPAHPTDPHPDPTADHRGPRPGGLLPC